MKFASLILLSVAVAIQGRTVGSSSAITNVEEVPPAPIVQGITWEDTVEDFPTTEFPFAGQDGGDYYS